MSTYQQRLAVALTEAYGDGFHDGQVGTESWDGDAEARAFLRNNPVAAPRAATEPDWERLYVEESERYARLSNQMTRERLAAALAWAMAPNPRYEGRHRTEPRCREFMPTDGTCDCGYTEARAVLLEALAPTSASDLSCLGCGQVRTPSTWDAQSHSYLCVECVEAIRPGTTGRITHGRHCRCTPCMREDWTNPKLAPCDTHGPSCPNPEGEK